MAQDVDGLKRDMVRVAALAERGGAVKDHLTRLSRRVDELEGGAKAKNDVVALEARLSRIARASEGARDHLAADVERLSQQIALLAEGLSAATARLDALVAERDAAPTQAAEKRKPDKAADASARGDDLRRIKGIGPKFATALNAVGIHTWAEVAAWSDADIDEVAPKIGIQAARIRKAGWVASAKALVAG